MIIYIEVLWTLLLTLIPQQLNEFVEFDEILFSVLQYIMYSCMPLYDAIFVAFGYLVS